MIYEIWCNGKLHYTRPEGHPDIQEALDLIERTNRLFGTSAYEVRAQHSVHPTVLTHCPNDGNLLLMGFCDQCKSQYPHSG